MEVNSVPAQALPVSAAEQKPARGAAAVGKDTFLKLLIAQLEHQDPLSPMENAEFTAQLAQFNTLEQTEAMNASLKDLLAAQHSVNGLQAAALIGKEVEARGDSMHVRPGETSHLRYNLADDSTQTTIQVFDNTGNLVRTLESAGQQAGTHSVAWDGKDALGTALPDGHYRFTVTALNERGKAVEVDTFLQGTVESVAFIDNRPFLQVDGTEVELTALSSVRQAP